MLARSAMIVVFVLDEVINPGRLILTAVVFPKGNYGITTLKVPQRRAILETE